MTQSLEDLLLANGAISEAQLKEAHALARNGEFSVGAALVKLGHLEEVDVARAQAKAERMPFVDLAKAGLNISPAILEKVPEDLAKEQGLLPVVERDGKLVVAEIEPDDRDTIDNVNDMLDTVGRVTDTIDKIRRLGF